MARIKLDIPATTLDILNIAVRITDINYGNHLGNDALVSIIHEARLLWLKKHNYSELDAAGAGLIMSDLAVEYLNEAFYGDILSITVSSGEISRVGFELFYLVETKRNEKNLTVAKVKTGMICYDYAKRKVISVPDGLKNIVRVL